MKQDKTMTTNVLFCWSSGKDSALALSEIRASGRYSIVSLLTTVTEEYDRISMHGVRTALLVQQSVALGIPLQKVVITKDSTNDDFETRLGVILEGFRNRGVVDVVFGDIFLEDLRKYREANLAKVGMNAIFPLWKRDTGLLARSVIKSGFKAIVTCVDTHVLGAGFAGREFDETFLADLPPSVDPCGENGEFHTFTYAGPVFDKEIPVKRGDVVLRDDRFCFCDLLPA